MNDPGGQQDHLNGHSGFILAVFCIVSIFVIWPVRIPLPNHVQRLLLLALRQGRIIFDDEYSRTLSARGRLYFSLSLKTAPVVGVILLLVTTTIHGSTIKVGIKGDESIKPYDVLVLFISLAYISIALDGTGALEALALWAFKRGGSPGQLLLTYLYSFFLLTTCIVGNDPLILSGTPFLAYLTHHAKLEPEAWIFSEFMAANTASVVLASSNPTNILIAGSFSLNYLTDFTKWTILPSIVPAILTYPILIGMFWNKIPKTLTPLEINPWSKLGDRTGAIVLSSLMLVTVAVLVGTSFVPGHVVEVASDLWRPTTRKGAVHQQATDPSTEDHSIDKTGTAATQDQLQLNEVTKLAEEEPKPEPEPGPESSLSRDLDDKYSWRTSKGKRRSFISLPRSLARRFPGTTRTLARLPITLLPFAMCEFILVRGLEQRGWIAVFTRGFANACTTPTKTVFFMGFISAVFLCPLVGTNIGATIILVEIMRDPAFSQSPAALADPRILLGAIYLVAMGSNIGVFSYTFAGSLAGLLWRELLADKGIMVSQLKFAHVNALPLLMQITTASAIVLGELYWFA
ncbi:hypothetical protein LTR06_011093 [Exophiala xenobiotica]|nr:hypothetical protein LTR06_011093 [Exophiala xenobiotica]